MSTLGWIVIGWIMATVVVLRFNYNASRLSEALDDPRDRGY